MFPAVSVLELDTESREMTVVMENLRFPNGIQLLPDEESVLVAETTMARIRRCGPHVPGQDIQLATGQRLLFTYLI